MIVRSDRRQDSLLSFSHNIFFLIKDKFHILSYIKVTVCKFFKFWTRLKMCCLVKEFDLSLFIICLYPYVLLCHDLLHFWSCYFLKCENKQRHTQWKKKYKIKSKWVCFSIEWLIDCMVLNFIFNIILVISQHPVQVSVLR